MCTLVTINNWNLHYVYPGEQCEYIITNLFFLNMLLWYGLFYTMKGAHHRNFCVPLCSWCSRVLMQFIWKKLILMSKTEHSGVLSAPGAHKFWWALSGYFVVHTDTPKRTIFYWCALWWSLKEENIKQFVFMCTLRIILRSHIYIYDMNNHAHFSI